jgi:glycosyltransferase involved in cell wall biosynthesis
VRRVPHLISRRFTVVTPTFNRAHTLPRVYESLTAQTERDFDWLVVDDGSSDGTLGYLEALKPSAPFPLSVIALPTNRGKHIALNEAFGRLSGVLTVVLDSDDELLPDSLANLWAAYESLTAAEKEKVGGILGNSVSAEGEVVGQEYREYSRRGFLLPLVAQKYIVGDKLPCYRSDLLGRHRFPELPGRKQVIPEGVVWMLIGSEHEVLCVNVPVLRVHRDLSDPISLMNSYRSRRSNAAGLVIYSRVVVGLAPRFFSRYPAYFVMWAARGFRYALHAGDPLGGVLSTSRTPLGVFLTAVGLPLGWAAWFVDCVLERVKRR